MGPDSVIQERRREPSSDSVGQRQRSTFSSDLPYLCSCSTSVTESIIRNEISLIASMSSRRYYEQPCGAITTQLTPPANLMCQRISACQVQPATYYDITVAQVVD